MPLFLLKSVLAVLFLVAGAVGTLAMFCLMGKTEHKTSPMTLRRLHRSMGFIFVLLLVITSVLCARYVARVGDQVSLRAALHGTLAVLLVGVLAVKLFIIKWYKGLLSLVPVLGIIVFVLAFAVVATSAGYYFLRMGGGAPAGEKPEARSGVIAAAAAGDRERGRAVFEENCSACHATDNDDPGFAPGLKGVLKKDTLPDSGRPATVENIVSQLREPVGMMPSYSSITGQDLSDLIEYMKAL
jgi:mono/diheme cytochrome c family protein